MSTDANTVVIASAARTPVGSFNGSLSSLPAHELGRVAIEAALERAGIEGGDVDEVILGQILTAGTGQNPARQASIAAGIPVDAPAWGMNQLCGSDNSPRFIRLKTSIARSPATIQGSFWTSLLSCSLLVEGG